MIKDKLLQEIKRVTEIMNTTDNLFKKAAIRSEIHTAKTHISHGDLHYMFESYDKLKVIF